MNNIIIWREMTHWLPFTHSIHRKEVSKKYIIGNLDEGGEGKGKETYRKYYYVNKFNFCNAKQTSIKTMAIKEKQNVCVCVCGTGNMVCTRFTVQTYRTSIPVCNPVPFRMMSHTYIERHQAFSLSKSQRVRLAFVGVRVYVARTLLCCMCTRYTNLTINKWKAAALIDLHLIKCWRGALTLRQALSVSFPLNNSNSNNKKGITTQHNKHGHTNVSKWTNKKAIECERNAFTFIVKKRDWSKKF